MKLIDFAESRNVEQTTVRRYIDRHPEIKSHTSRERGKMELDEVAVKALDEVYPVPKPVTVIQGVPQEEYESLLLKYAAVQEQIARIQSDRIEESKQLIEIKTRALLLEDKENQLADTECRLTERTKELEESRKEVTALQSEIDRLHRRSMWQRIIDK